MASETRPAPGADYPDNEPVADVAAMFMPPVAIPVITGSIVLFSSLPTTITNTSLVTVTWS